MSISQALNNAVSGLTANSRMAEVASSNLSNALTEGYGRRQLEVSAADMGGYGTGVRVDGLVRDVDKGIIGDRRLADAALAGQDRMADFLSRLENAVGAVDDPASLSARLAAFEGALINAGSDPASEQRLSLALSRLGDVTGTLQNAAREVQQLRQDADTAIARDIDLLNAKLAEVEQLNSDIVRTDSRGLDPSALYDQRQRAIDVIGDIVPVRELVRENGRLALMTTSGELILDGSAPTYDFQQTNTIVAQMTLASGALDGVSRDGNPMSSVNGFGRLDGGSLAAAFTLRDEILTNAQTGMDEVAADLIVRFSDPAVDPSIFAGDPGLLTDGGAAYDPLTLDGLAQRISINASVDPAQGGLISRWRDGVGAIGSGPVGNATQLNAWVDALSSRQSIGPGIPDASARGHVAVLTSDIGTSRVRSDEALAFAAARRDMLYQAELESGVDSDQELQNLLRIEQAYAANAKVVQTVGAMMQTLMEI